MELSLEDLVIIKALKENPQITQKDLAVKVGKSERSIKRKTVLLQEKGFTSMKVLHNNAYIVEDVAVCGTRGWLYNSETEEDVKIVNREVGRLVASLNDAAKQDANAQPIVFLHYPPVYGNMACAGILDVLETRHVEQCYFGHIHGNQASKKAVRGNYHGIKMHLISCDYVNFMPILVK